MVAVAGYERIRSSINLLKFHVTQFCSTYVVLRQIRFGLLLGRVCDQLRWELDRQTLRELGERRWHRDLRHLRVSVRVWMRVTVSVRVEVKFKLKVKIRVRVRGQGSGFTFGPVADFVGGLALASLEAGFDAGFEGDDTVLSPDGSKSPNLRLGSESLSKKPPPALGGGAGAGAGPSAAFWTKMRGMWCVVCGEWCGVWRVACGVWRVACGVWRVACSVKCFRISCPSVWLWCMGEGGAHLAKAQHGLLRALRARNR